MTTAFWRARKARDKLRWGITVVGVAPSVVGIARLAAMKVRHRPEGVVRLRSGPVLGFDYPRQLVPALVAFGDYIDPEFEFLRQVARPDWIVLDVGAAIGQFSVFVAMLPTAHVHAFEPSSGNIRTLKSNLRRNQVASRVTVKQMALSVRDAEMAFPTLQNPFLSRLDRPDKSVGNEMIPVRTLTGIAADLGLAQVECLKLNVAGFEGEVIEGAQDFFTHQRADVLIILISAGSMAWFARIAALGYRFFFFHPPRNTLYEVNDLNDLPSQERPWPARHLIGVSGHAIERGMLRDVAVVAAEAQ